MLWSIYTSNTVCYDWPFNSDGLQTETSLNKYSLHLRSVTLLFSLTHKLLLCWGWSCDSSSTGSPTPHWLQNKTTHEDRTPLSCVHVVALFFLKDLCWSSVFVFVFIRAKSKAGWTIKSALFSLAGGCLVGWLGDRLFIFLKQWLSRRGGETTVVGWPSHSRLVPAHGVSTACRGNVGVLVRLHQAALILFHISVCVKVI